MLYKYTRTLFRKLDLFFKFRDKNENIFLKGYIDLKWFNSLCALFLFLCSMYFFIRQSYLIFVSMHLNYARFITFFNYYILLCLFF